MLIAAYAGLYVLISAGVVWATVRMSQSPWAGWAVAMLLLVCAIVLLDSLYPRISLFVPSIHRIPQHPGRNTIALTFDDGPVHPFTGQILDILDHFGVKASFFCIGDNVRRNPDLALEILRRGHTLGNHTQTHGSLLFKGAHRVAREIVDAQLTISQGCGHKPTFFRCPKGYKSPVMAGVLRRARLTLVAYGYPIWDVENPPAGDLIERVLNRAAPGDIIVMHDGFPPGKPGNRDQLVAALPHVIEGLLAKDILPLSLDEALA